MGLDGYGEEILYWQQPVDLQHGFPIVRGENSREGYLPKIIRCIRTFREAALSPFYRGGKNSDCPSVWSPDQRTSIPWDHVRKAHSQVCARPTESEALEIEASRLFQQALRVIPMHAEVWKYVSGRLGVRMQMCLIPKPLPLGRFD